MDKAFNTEFLSIITKLMRLYEQSLKEEPSSGYLDLSSTARYYFNDVETMNIDKLITQTIKNEKKESSFLEFTEQEILKMPKQFRKEFRTDGCTARITKRKSGKNNYCYEIRYRRNGYNISATSTNLQKAKDKFIERLANSQKPNNTKVFKVPNNFHDFAMHYFENFHIKKVGEPTYKKHLRLYDIYIKAPLAKSNLRNITPNHCETILDEILEKGHGRTCEEIHSILNQIFKMALIYTKIAINPLALLVYQKHERETGAAISKEDEKLLLEKLKKTELLLPFALLLYTGVRPNELYTIYIEGDFIIANNSKRKGRKIETKKIAISPMLRPYLKKPFNSTTFPKMRFLRDKLQQILPKHTLKDCRTTFSTRCQECGVSDIVIKLFMGHSLKDVLGKHYTDFSDEYYIRESQKIIY